MQDFKFRSAEPLRCRNFSKHARFTNKDSVVVYFGTAGIISNCKVIKVHLTESSISYDVEFKWRHIESAELISAGVDKDTEITSRLYNLPSAVVFSPMDFDMPQSIKQKEANLVVRLKSHVEKCLKESGLPPYDLREEWRTKFFDRLGEGAVDALKVEGCVEKYIRKQNKES